MAALSYTGMSTRRYDPIDPEKQLIRPEQHCSVHSQIGTSIEIFVYLEHVAIQVDIYARGYIYIYGSV